jgi:hypothetical protein
MPPFGQVAFWIIVSIGVSVIVCQVADFLIKQGYI